MKWWKPYNKYLLPETWGFERFKECIGMLGSGFQHEKEQQQHQHVINAIVTVYHFCRTRCERAMRYFYYWWWMVGEEHWTLNSINNLLIELELCVQWLLLLCWSVSLFTISHHLDWNIFLYIFFICNAHKTLTNISAFQRWFELVNPSWLLWCIIKFDEYNKESQPKRWLCADLFRAFCKNNNLFTFCHWIKCVHNKWKHRLHFKRSLPQKFML